MKRITWHLEKRGCEKPYRVKELVNGAISKTKFYPTKNAAISAFNRAAAQQQIHLHDCTPSQ